MDLTIHHTVSGDYARVTGSFEVRTQEDVEKLLTALALVGEILAVPTGPKNQKRPADVIGAAVRVARIATGEEPEILPLDGPAQELGKKGGAARAASLTPERRSEIAKIAATKRWTKG